MTVREDVLIRLPVNKTSGVGAVSDILIWLMGCVFPMAVLFWSGYCFLTWPIGRDPFPYEDVLGGGCLAGITFLIFIGSRRYFKPARRRKKLLVRFSLLITVVLVAGIGIQIWASSTVGSSADLLRGSGSLKVSDAMIAATVSMEDQHFYSHGGVDWAAMHDALRNDVRSGRIIQGGSTITQQLAKNLFLSNDRTLWRKCLEIPLAFSLEQNLSKSQLLNLYMEKIPYGMGTRGIEEAARLYFHTTPDQLTLAESAILVGMVPRNPSKMPSLTKLASWRNTALDRIAAVYGDRVSAADIASARTIPVERLLYPFKTALDRGASERIPSGWQGVLWYFYSTEDPEGVPNVSPELKRRLGAFAMDARKQYSVIAIHHLGAFADRSVRNHPGLMSSHAYGNAIDIYGFDFADGVRITVNKHADPMTLARLKPLIKLFEKHFDTVVDWMNEPKLHQDHVHAEVRRAGQASTDKEEI